MNDLRIGTDLVEVERIKRSSLSWRFMQTVYSQSERELFEKKKVPWQSMAGNWAAKEAFSKALGTGVSGFSLNEVQCLRNENGQPYFEFTGMAKQIVEKEAFTVRVSISHTEKYATATVIVYKE